jgi:serine phosphatase RsbU (regulator of sigma subunit)
MKWRFTISRKIALGFGLFICAVVVIFFITSRTLATGLETNQKITRIYAPSLRNVEELDNILLRSFQLMDHWVHVQSREDDIHKIELKQVLSARLPEQMQSMNELSFNWEADDRLCKDRLFRNIDRLTLAYNQTMSLLPDFTSYNDPFAIISAEQTFMSGEIIDVLFDQIQADLDVLAESHEEKLLNATESANNAYSAVTKFTMWFMFGTIVGGMMIAFVVIRTIVKPINLLKKTLLYLGKGIYPRTAISVSNDEIGDMSFAVNKLVDGLRKTKEFSTRVGTGDFRAMYQPLSEEDELGHALLKMRDELKENEKELERKVEERTNEVVHQKEKLERQKEEVTRLYKDLTDSINYARRIQQTILPPDNMISKMFPESFVFYLPKDIVSGDFYWFKTSGRKKMFAAVDCTGHGVPGAFMSLVGHNVLNQVTKVFTKPSQVLNNLNRMASEVLDATDAHHMRDGMDLAFCTLDSDTMELEFAGAYNSVLVIRNHEIIERKGDKFSIGSFNYGDRHYTNHVLNLQPGDCIYIFSDGYADQFGGPRNKKFLRKRFRRLLLEIHQESMSKQQDALLNTYEKWRGVYEQIDDILVIGVQV